MFSFFRDGRIDVSKRNGREESTTYSITQVTWRGGVELLVIQTFFSVRPRIMEIAVKG
ncbi:hypothetical protein WG66_013495 [Moniliophthora roreri]|nr:hypothetical protein WG66_013495 [Moniliophthora roreri]